MYASLFLHHDQLQSGASTPLKHRRSLRAGKKRGVENHAYFHEGGGDEILRGERKIKLLKHIFTLYSLLACSIAFYPPIKNAHMQRDFTNPSYIFLYFLVLSLTASFQNAQKHV